MHHPTDRIIHTTAFNTQVVEHWLERDIAQWVPDLGLGTNIGNLTGNNNLLRSAEKSLLNKGLNYVPIRS